MHRPITTAIHVGAFVAVAYSVAIAKNVTWNNDSGTGEWNTDDYNWGGGVLFEAGDDVFVQRPASPQGTIFVGKEGSPVDVAPASVRFSGGYGWAWTFTGGDLTAGNIQMNQDNTANFDRDASYSFDGGTFLNANGGIAYRPPTATGNLLFGTGAIQFNYGSFLFQPGTFGAVLTNRFSVGANGGSLGGNANAAFNSRVSMTSASGLLTVHGRNIFGGLTVGITGSGTIRIEPLFYASTGWGQFNGIVDGGDSASVTINNSGGVPTDYYIELMGMGGWSVSNVTFTGGQHTIVPNSGVFFSGVKANGGKVTLSGPGIVAPSTGNNGNNANAKSGTYTIAADHVVNAQLRAATINVGSNSTVSGVGTLYANNVVAGSGSAGSLAPGHPVGTLTNSANLTLGAEAALVFDLAEPDVIGGGVNDLLVINGNLTVNGGVVSIHPMNGFGPGEYVLATYSGDFSSTASLELDELPPIYKGELTVDQDRKQILLAIERVYRGTIILIE